MSPAVVQKYLTIVDLTCGKRAETTDQPTMLVALAERLRGMAQALGNPDGLESQIGKSDPAAISDLYAW